MTSAAVVLFVIAGVAMVANWWSRFTDHRPTELWSKPLALIALTGAAIAIDPADPTVRAWFVAGLVLSLAGDVFLMDGDRFFLPGLASFLAAHVVYTIGFVVADDWRWVGFAVGAVVMVVVGALLGRHIVAGASARSPVLGGAVVAYLVAIGTMFAAAIAAGNGVAWLGAGLFVASDTILGWRMFVREQRWMAPAIMVTYHLGQLGLVLSLL